MATTTFTARTAQRILAEHGLAAQGWTFGYDRALNRFGCCHYNDLKITVSGKTLAARTEDEVEQTLLHEAAHALVGPGHGHDRVWLAKARSIGYQGGTASKRTAAVAEARAAQCRHVGTCADCGEQIGKARAPRAGATYRHRPCAHKAGKGVITWTTR